MFWQDKGILIILNFVTCSSMLLMVPFILMKKYKLKDGYKVGVVV